MRHQVAGKKLNLTANHRQALYKTQLRDLFEKASLTTTLVKAKLLQKNAEKMLTKAKDKSIHNLRQLEAELSSKKSAHKAVELADRLLFEHGFVTITRMNRRRGDNVMMARVSLSLKPEESKSEDTKKTTKKIKAIKKDAKSDKQVNKK